MARKPSKALRQQQMIVGAVVAVFAGIAVWIAFSILSAAPSGGYQAGVHYELVDNPRPSRGDRIEVIEFFSYGCVHCFRFDPMLTDWLEERADTIDFKRSPVFTGNQSWRTWARNFFTMHELGIWEDNHAALFRMIHDLNQPLDTPARLANWFDGRGTTRDAYLEAYRSKAVGDRMNAADRRQRQLQVASVPTLVVAGKYRIKPSSDVGLGRILDVADYLIELESAGPATAPQSTGDD